MHDYVANAAEQSPTNRSRITTNPYNPQLYSLKSSEPHRDGTR